jgi:hypothetical protein
MKYTEDFDRRYAEWEQRVKDQKMRENIVALYQARFGAMPEDMGAVIAHIRGENALLRILIATGTRAAEDVSAVVREVVHDILRQTSGVTRTVVRDIARAGGRGFDDVHTRIRTPVQ